MRRLSRFLVPLMLASIWLAPPAVAGKSQPAGRCADGFQSLTLKGLNQLQPQYSKQENATFFNSVDKNQDGYICYRDIPEPEGSSDVYQFVDNNAQ